jgi:hypothetical protein
MSNPPPEVIAAAAVVERWTAASEKATGTKSAEEFAKLSPAERLNYVRGFDQSKMPAWKDPRAAK